MIALPKPGNDPTFPQNLRPISLLSMTGKLFEKVVLKIFQRHIERKNLLNASQFGFQVDHIMTLQCMRLTDHITLNFNNEMSTAAVLFDIEKAFDTLQHPGLLYKLSTMEFATKLIKLISSFLSQRKFRVSVEGEMPKPRDIEAGVPQGSILYPTLYNLYINYTPQTTGISVALFVDDTVLYATEYKEGYVLRKPQSWQSSGVNTRT
jgi:hypothetical protein